MVQKIYFGKFMNIALVMSVNDAKIVPSLKMKDLYDTEFENICCK